MSAIGVGAQRFSGGRVIERTAGSLQRNFKTFGLLGLLFISLPGLASQILDIVVGEPAASPERIGILTPAPIVASLIGLVAYGGAIAGAAADMNGRRLGLRDLCEEGARAFLPLLFVGLCALVPLVLGFAFLLVPGAILAVIWSVAWPVQVVEKPGGLRAFGRSAALTRGHRWGIFGLGVLYGVALLIVCGVFYGIVAAAGMSAARTADPVPLAFVALTLASLVNGILSIASAVFSAALYFELRAARDGLAPRELADIFE